MSSRSIHYEARVGPFIHTGQPHKVSARSLNGLFWGSSTQPVGCSAPQHAGNLNREFLLTNFHQHACLVRQSLTVGGKRRQLAYCPYCGIINRNADTALSHVRKHLDLLFVCGACHVKSYVSRHAVQRHMTYQYVSAMAIVAKPKTSRR